MTSREHYHPYDEEDPEELKPVRPEPKKLVCKHEPNRIVVPDGYGEFVHQNESGYVGYEGKVYSYTYSCDLSDPHTTFAEPRS